MKSANMKLVVPYYSQFADINDPFWIVRACGAACLKMVAEFYHKETPDLVTLGNEARERGGYDMANGWVHDYIVTKAQELGLSAQRKEGLTMTEEITASLDAGNPVIVSVEKKVLEQKRFHMVVIVGYEDGVFIYHEPESTDREKGQYRTCDIQTFTSYWRGKAIFIIPLS
jgi:ABC-type bacteriocin/lantibiotic exporter with double-glycine peptidase domain